MHGPAGVLTVVLFEAALGSLALLWLVPLWGVVRPGFFKLVGASVLACAALAWWAGAGDLATAGATGRAAARWLAVFALAALAWQALLYARAGWSRGVGIAALAPGLVAGALLAELSGRPVLGGLALGAGALFLGATVDGLLLGHWYLVDRRLSARPILVLATWLVAGVVAAVVSAALGGRRGSGIDQQLSPLLAFPNLTVYQAFGLVVLCGLLAWFIRVLVRGGSVQAATGMFYLAVILALAAEFAAKVYFFGS